MIKYKKLEKIVIIKKLNFSYIRTRLAMEENTDNLYNARLRNVRRRLFQDDGDNDKQQKRENIDNSFAEEMRIQLEQVRNTRFFFNRSNLND